ncbi:MAG: hypothetical protein RL076_2751, partial [Chloroflexota bacterium]
MGRMTGEYYSPLRWGGLPAHGMRHDDGGITGAWYT